VKTYIGDLVDSGCGGQEVTVCRVERHKVDKQKLPLEPSLKLYAHSPTGFNWGYQGSGPAQLALAILFDLTGDTDLSVRLHQDFKRHFIATSGERLIITEPDIRAWLVWKAKVTDANLRR